MSAIKGDGILTSTASNLIASAFNIFIGLFIGIAVTRALGPELKGQYASIMLIITLYAPLMMFGYQGGILYYAMSKTINPKFFFFSGLIVNFLFSTIIALSMYALTSHGIFGSISKNVVKPDLIVGLFSIPVVLLASYCNRILRSFGLFKIGNIRTIIGSVVTAIFYLTLILFDNLKLVTVLYGYIIGQLVEFCTSFLFIINKINPVWHWDMKQILLPMRYGLKDWASVVISKSNDKFDLIILSFLMSAGTFGIYNVAIGLAGLVSVIPSSYLDVFYFQIANLERREGLNLYAKSTRITLFITLIICLALIAVGYPLILMLYGKAFSMAYLALVFYSPGIVFLVGARISIKFYAGIGRPLRNSLVYLFGFCISLPFYYLLIPKFGIIGAAISSSIAYFGAFLFSFFQIHKEYNVSIGDILIYKKEDFDYIRLQLTKFPIFGNYFQPK